MNKWWIWTLSFFFIAASLPLAAQEFNGGVNETSSSGSSQASRSGEETSVDQSETTPEIWKHDYLTGDWGGEREKLAKRGITPGLNYTGEAFGLLSGGMSRKQNAVYDGLLNPFITIDTEKAIGLKGGTFYVSAFWIHGSSLTKDSVGDLSVVSNIDAYDTLRLGDLYYDQDFFDEKVSLRVGQFLADEEFFVSSYGNLFISGTFGAFNLLGQNFLTPAVYPTAAPGLRLRVNPDPKFYIAAAVFNGDAEAETVNRNSTRFPLNSQDGVMSYFETGYKWNQGKDDKGLPGTYKLGAFYHSSTPKLIDYRTSVGGKDDYAVYAVADQLVWRRPDGDDKKPCGVGVFCRCGGAPDALNLVSWYAEGGVNWIGPCQERDEDTFGIGVACTNISSAASTANEKAGLGPLNSETVIEATYRARLGPGWFIQPDFQYIFTPSASPNVQDAVVIGVRTSLVF